MENFIAPFAIFSFDLALHIALSNLAPQKKDRCDIASKTQVRCHGAAQSDGLDKEAKSRNHLAFVPSQYVIYHFQVKHFGYAPPQNQVFHKYNSASI